MSLPDAGDPGAGLPPSGDARVDAARAELAQLDSLGAADHVAVYERVHQRLQEALADVDEGT